MKDNKVFDKGVIIFPIGTNVNEKGIEKTKNSIKGSFVEQAETIIDMFESKSQL